MKKVAVLMGGRSEERDISFKTGKAVLKALKVKGYKAIGIDARGNFINNLLDFNPDIVFIALHGPFGEDGTVQGLLELLDIPYCGCGVLASAVAMNKIYTKKLLLQENIPTADFHIVSFNQYRSKKKEIMGQLEKKLGIPLVVKAPCQGSTIGIYFVNKREELDNALVNAFKYDNKILVEKYIKGMEVTVAVIGNEEPVALPIIEIISHTGVYDYEAKYTKGLSEHIIPARLPEEIRLKIKDLAIKAYKALDCKGFARVDFMVENNRTPLVLEVNTIPGMTETSLLPDAAKAAGISFENLIDYFIKLAAGEKPELTLIET